MAQQFSVRYGRNYKVVLAIVLPSLLIVPFIFLMQRFKNLTEWEIWLLIFTFLGFVIVLSVWLVLRVYPPAVLNIHKNEISLSFKPEIFLSTSDFSVKVSDIISITRREIGGDAYFLFETQNPNRKFQISAQSNSSADLCDFNNAMAAISELVEIR